MAPHQSRLGNKGSLGSRLVCSGFLPLHPVSSKHVYRDQRVLACLRAWPCQIRTTSSCVTFSRSFFGHDASTTWTVMQQAYAYGFLS